MRWLKPSLRSIYGLLGNASAPTDSLLEGGIEEVREAMLASLEHAGPGQFQPLTRRIRYANDIQSLWYLRGDLMAALAAMHGESVARRKMAGITEQFEGLLPGSMTSRPSPLIS
ncbi:MAG TPA: hypothetical protein VIE63_12275 [Ramlibacter sp.]|jgi:hypothetical protein